MFDSSEGQMAKEAESRCPEYRWPCIARDAIYIPTGATPWGYWKSIVRWEKAMSANSTSAVYMKKASNHRLIKQLGTSVLCLPFEVQG